MQAKGQTGKHAGWLSREPMAKIKVTVGYCAIYCRLAGAGLKVVSPLIRPRRETGAPDRAIFLTVITSHSCLCENIMLCSINT